MIFPRIVKFKEFQTVDRKFLHGFKISVCEENNLKKEQRFRS